jgi:hypothetical protein
MDADQRYDAVGAGRFNVPDPYMASVGTEDPGSWNRFAYVGGDPINFQDPSGRWRCLYCDDDEIDSFIDDQSQRKQPTGPERAGDRGGGTTGSSGSPSASDLFANLSADCQSGLTAAISGGTTEQKLAALNRAVAV